MPQKVEYPPIYPLLIEVLRKDFPPLVFDPKNPAAQTDFAFNAGQLSIIDKLEVKMKHQQEQNKGGNT